MSFLSNKKFLGASVVISAFFAVFSLFGYRATFAILKIPMSSELNWSQTEITLGYSVMMLIYAVTAFISGVILDKFGTRPIYIIAAIFGWAGFYFTSFVSSFGYYLISYGFLAGLSTGMLWVSSTVSVRKWFVGKSYSTVWGIAFAGAPLAQWVLSDVTNFLLIPDDPSSWRNVMFVLSFIILGLLILSSVFARRNPEIYNHQPFGFNNDKRSGEKVWKIGEAYKTYPIWGIIFLFLTSMMAEFLIWTQLVSYWTNDLNFSLDLSTSVYKFIGIVGIFSMPVLGFFADKIVAKLKDEKRGRKIMLIVGPLTGFVACLILLLTKDIFYSYLAAAVFACYWAIVPGGVVGYSGAVYGRATLGKIWGLATLIVMGIGPFLGSFIGAYLVDLSGSYFNSILFAMGAFLVSTIFAFTLPVKAIEK